MHSTNAINLSVPQGSILGSLLSIIYVNDFPHCLKHGTSLSFQDDTSIFISDKTTQLLLDKGNDELCNIDNWLLPGCHHDLAKCKQNKVCIFHDC